MLAQRQTHRFRLLHALSLCELHGCPVLHRNIPQMHAGGSIAAKMATATSVAASHRFLSCSMRIFEAGMPMLLAAAHVSPRSL